MLEVSRFLTDQTIIKSENCPKEPKISVIMPTYCRGGTTLKRAIESVLNQTFNKFEFIIIVDGSRDATLNIVKNYQEKDPRIIIIHHESNCGLPALRVNEGIKIAKGKYICYHFDDDIYLPNTLAILYTEIEKHTEPCLVYGSCEVHLTKRNISRVLGRPFNYGLLMNGNYIANNAVIHHKDIFEIVGLYDPHVILRRFCDYDLWLRMARKVPFYWVDKMITRVYAEMDHSVGVDVPYIQRIIKKYLEIPRDNQLLPDRIEKYDVDGINILRDYFTTREIDKISRSYLIPYRVRVPYFLQEHETYLATVSRPRKRTLAVTKSDFSTSVDVTIRNYTQRISNFPYNYFFLNEASCLQLDPSDYSVLGLYRTIGKLSTQLLKEHKELGKPVAYFMDDNMFKFHELGKKFEYLKPNTDYYNNLQYQIKNCHAVISYNPLISTDARKYNKNVIQLNTNIPCQFLKLKYDSMEEKKIKIAIFSGDVRRQIFRNIWSALERISRKYRDAIEFHFYGMNPQEFGKLESPVYFVPFTHSYDKYITMLTESFFHYHICPLDGTHDVSLSKSPIKFLEGTVAGAVGIFSNVDPYKSIPRHFCLKADNTIDSWFDTVDRAISLEKNRRWNMYKLAFDHIASFYSSETQVHAFIAALEAVELTARLNGKKIAYFFHDAYLGGATLHLLKHALIAKKYGVEPIFCIPTYLKHILDLPILAQKYHIEVNYVNYKRFVDLISPDKPSLNEAIELSNWMKGKNIGMVHSVTFMPSVGTACKMNGIPHIASLHQFYSNKSSKEQIMNNVLIDMVHSSSNINADTWSSSLRVPARKMPCPVEDHFYNLYHQKVSLKRETNRTIKILLSGTIQERKNQLSAIKAISILKGKGYKVILDIIGYEQLVKDYTNKCRETIQQNGLMHEVKIRGFTEHVQEFYSHSDILLCCSKDESMPQTILQAMAAGVLVVSTEIAGIKELIKDNYTGILYSGTDEQSIAAALEKAMRLTPQQRMDILINAHKTVKMVADHQFISAELLNLYNEAFEIQKNHSIPKLLKDSYKND